jgi:hypothetical protein
VTIRLSPIRGATGDTLETPAGYGVVSFGTRDLDRVRNYVRNHEKMGTGAGGPAKNA